MHKRDVCSLLLLLALSRFVPADLCEAECDSHPLRTHVGRVLQRSLGIDPADVTLEARFMVRAGATHKHTSPSCQRCSKRLCCLSERTCVSGWRQGAADNAAWVKT